VRLTFLVLPILPNAMAP